MIINWFSRTPKSNKLQEEATKEYASICGIIEVIEFSKTEKEINGVLLDSEGREFEFKIMPNGDLLRLTGVKEDMPFAWNICVNYLKNAYGNNEIKELRAEMNTKFQYLRSAIEDLSEDISDIEIPEIVQQVEQKPAIQEPTYIPSLQIDEQSFEDEEKEYEDQFQDFSDEDLASHALKVLSGEVSLSNS